jgi:hypothetical protein
MIACAPEAEPAVEVAVCANAEALVANANASAVAPTMFM